MGTEFPIKISRMVVILYLILYTYRVIPSKYHCTPQKPANLTSSPGKSSRIPCAHRLRLGFKCLLTLWGLRPAWGSSQSNAHGTRLDLFIPSVAECPHVLILPRIKLLVSHLPAWQTCPPSPKGSSRLKGNPRCHRGSNQQP